MSMNGMSPVKQEEATGPKIGTGLAKAVNAAACVKSRKKKQWVKLHNDTVDQRTVLTSKSTE